MPRFAYRRVIVFVALLCQIGTAVFGNAAMAHVAMSAPVAVEAPTSAAAHCDKHDVTDVSAMAFDANHAPSHAHTDHASPYSHADHASSHSHTGHASSHSHTDANGCGTSACKCPCAHAAGIGAEVTLASPSVRHPPMINASVVSAPPVRITPFFRPPIA